MRTWQALSCVGACVWLCGSTAMADQPGPVGQWYLNEGRDSHIHDASGNENHGMAQGAGWVELKKGYALEFDGGDSRVNCGAGKSLDVRGPVSMEAWIFPTAPANSETGIAGKSFTSYGLTYYTDGRVYWYINNGANKCSAAVKPRVWTYVAATFDGKLMRLFVNGRLADTNTSQFNSVNPGREFLIGCIRKGGAPTRSFQGIVGSVCVYSRALADKEIRRHYLAEVKDHPRPPGKYDRMIVTAYPYLDRGEIVIDVDFTYIAPVEDSVKGTAELRQIEKGTEKVLKTCRLPKLPLSGVLRDVKLDVGKVGAGDYTLRVSLAGPAGVRSQAAVAISYPHKLVVPDPAEQTVPPLPPPTGPVNYAIELGKGGGFTIALKGDRYPVESTYSYPRGGHNTLSAGAAPAGDAEPGWNVTTQRIDAITHRVNATGKHYTIRRRIEHRPTHVIIRDTITNVSGDVIGVLLSNHVETDGIAGLAIRRMPNPSVFLCKEGQGVGLVALDDVYLEQHKTYNNGARAGIRSDTFGLDKGASYTIEWAVYVNGTGDYYDFVKAVRKDLGYVRTIEGGFAFTDRRKSPSPDYVRNRALRYASIGCLGHAADDPGLSLEGVEFLKYPKECALLKATFAETLRRYPNMKVMFHIAHSLYTTNKPAELFGDSRVLNAAGKQTDYGSQNVAYYAKYYSKERVEQGYRWYIFYPTMTNSFGKFMLRAIDYMLDEIGVNSMFADGFTHGYGGRFTYDRWDGHTVEIDPKAKTVTRKYASVNLLAQDVLVAACRKIAAKGGVVIANSYPGTRTVHREKNLLYCLETAGGGRVCARLHLAPSVIALGNPAKCENARDVYDDVRDKLEWGGVYFYYGEKSVPPDTIVTQMYPITVEEIGQGIIRGCERIITLRPGVYGWQGSEDLHFVYRYDGRGVPAPHGFPTTVCQRGVRTKIDLLPGEAAVVKRIPVSIRSVSPVNVAVRQYDADGIQLVISAGNDVSIVVGNGDFSIEAGAAYIVRTANVGKRVVASDGRIACTVPAGQQTRVRIERAPKG